MKTLRLLFFLPSLFFIYLSVHLITASVTLTEAIKADIQSDLFINGVSQALNDPWLHHSALRFYFRKILAENASKPIWANSNMFARALWNQYQYVGTIEIMIVVAHAEDNPQEELYWATLYSKVLPRNKHAQALLEHALHSHALGKPLEIEGKW